jgi:TDG/mug DNA glycosylase family protein
MPSGRKHSFEPVWAADARVLILGTMPSEASLAQGFYYAHPRNAFWPMMFDILGEQDSREIGRRRALLLRHRIALWDVAASCVRPGSLDSAIREAAPNDILGLLERCPQVALVLLNGTTARALLKKLLPPLPVGSVLLPSTSPANTMPYARKRAAWAEYVAPARP